MNLFKLVGSIFVDNSAANDSISKTDEKASGLGNTLSKGIKTVAAWGTAIASAAVVAGTAIYSSATSAAAAADNIDKMSQKIGISREAYQELDFICSQSGMSVDTLQNGVKSLTAAMDGARDGTVSNVEQFERLGVAVTNADGSFRSQEEVLFDTLTALQGVSDQTEKARLATELFGKSGTELMPLLNGEAGSIEEMKQQAHDLGLVLSDELIDNGVNLTDSLDQTKRAFQSIAVNLGGSFMPIVEQISDYIQEFVPTLQDMIAGLSPTLTNLFEGMLPSLMMIITSVFPQLVDLVNVLIPIFNDIISVTLPVIVQLISMFLPAITEIISTVLPRALEILQPLLDLMSPILDLLQPILDIIVSLIGPLTSLLIVMLEPVIDLTVYLIESILPQLTETLTWLAAFIESIAPDIESFINSTEGIITTFFSQFKILADGVVTFISGILDIIMGTVNFYIALFNGDFESAGQALLQILEGLGNMILGLIEAAFFNVIASIMNGCAGIGEFFNNWGSKISNFFSNLWNNSIETARTRIEFLKNTITNILSSAADLVGGIVERMKGFFNFEFQIPSIKMPHFNINPTGWNLSKLLEGQIPKLGIEWYAKAMDDGMIMNRPTVFGINGNRLMAGGEAGSETIIGTESLMNKIQNAVSSSNSDAPTKYQLDEVIQLIIQFINVLSNLCIVLDTGELVGAISGPINERLGDYQLNEYRLV